VLAPSGLKTTQRAIPAQISRSEPTTVGAVAEALVIGPRCPRTHTLKPLERGRIVAIEIDPDDRRNRLITLTADIQECNIPASSCGSVASNCSHADIFVGHTPHGWRLCENATRTHRYGKVPNSSF
jgi:hypothetical protein